jgi:hypothetical protein
LRRPGSVSAESKDWPMKEQRVDKGNVADGYMALSVLKIKLFPRDRQ